MSTYHLDLVNGNDANTGADWANTWLTITTGAGAGDIAPGDTIKIAKTPDPVSIGTCAWTDLDKTVTRSGSPPAGSETLLVDDCESGWVADNSSTVTHPTTTMKSGSANVNVTKASYATATLYAHKALAAPIDCSGFVAITGWVRADAVVADTARWVIDLCSDADGLVVVDSFLVPAIPAANKSMPFRLTRVGGGALGASIASIAIRTGASAPTNGQDLQLDNINACNDFSMLSLISKSSAAQSGAATESWYALQSINGTTLEIDNDTETIASAGRGYSGTTETVTTYRRETFATGPHASSATDANLINDSGTDGSPITFSGGWNTSSGLQDGETFLDGRNGNGRGFQCSQSFVTISRLSAVRYSTGINLASSGHDIVLDIGNANHCAASGVACAAPNCDLTIGHCNNNGNSGALAISNANNRINVGAISNSNGNGLSASGGSGCSGSVARANNNTTAGASFASARGCVFDIAELRDNTTAQVAHTSGRNMIRGCTMTGTEFSGGTDYTDGRTYSANHDLSGYDKQFADGGTIYQEATDFDTPATGKMWALLTSAVTRTSNYPLKLRLPGVAVVANKLVTISARMRKAHATNVRGKLVLPGGQIAGVAADVVASLPDATTEDTVTITFTPTAAGVVVPEVWAEYVSGHAAVCIDRFTSITQAA